ncbi:MAG: nucleotide sugar dehydrogenase, partial [Acidimicrobiia bacterium]|nr:nucleotide sugar dehydrogenase [Acidimicrobiia bacterium]
MGNNIDLAVVGLGYVGLPLVVEAARSGLSVYGFDIDEAKIASLNSGKSYVEDISDDDVVAAVDAGFVAGSDPDRLAEAGAVVIAVPTPLANHLPDLSAVLAAGTQLGAVLRPGQLVVLESTTYPGTTEEDLRPLLEEQSGLTAGTDFFLAYSPERIDPGNPHWGLRNTPKLVAGVDAASTEAAVALYSKVCDEVVPLRGTREAEMAKLLENTYRHVNIALVNELAIFCRDLGVDIWDVIRGAATKPFGFQAFTPGPGVGGHCIPIDPGYLSYKVRELGYQFRLVELAQDINNRMPAYVVERIVSKLNDAGKALRGARIVVLGVAYKGGVSDTRESPSLHILERLLELGAEVAYVDPHVDKVEVGDQMVDRLEYSPEVGSGADIVV